MIEARGMGGEEEGRREDEIGRGRGVWKTREDRAFESKGEEQRRVADARGKRRSPEEIAEERKEKDVRKIRAVGIEESRT